MFKRLECLLADICLATSNAVRLAWVPPEVSTPPPDFPQVSSSINADNQPQLAQALQIQSVPMALAFIDEQPLALFDRFYPREQIALVIAKLFQLAQERGLIVDVPEVIPAGINLRG